MSIPIQDFTLLPESMSKVRRNSVGLACSFDSFICHASSRFIFYLLILFRAVAAALRTLASTSFFLGCSLFGFQFAYEDDPFRLFPH